MLTLQHLKTTNQAFPTGIVDEKSYAATRTAGVVPSAGGDRVPGPSRTPSSQRRVSVPDTKQREQGERR
jgi:hypothetical protein